MGVSSNEGRRVRQRVCSPPSDVIVCVESKSVFFYQPGINTVTKVCLCGQYSWYIAIFKIAAIFKCIYYMALG